MKTKLFLNSLIYFFISTILLSCTSTSTSNHSEKSFSVETNYTQLSNKYGYIRTDSILNIRVSISEDGKTVKEGEYLRSNYSIMHSTTFTLIYTDKEIKSKKFINQNDSIWHSIKKGTIIHKDEIYYEPQWEFGRYSKSSGLSSYYAYMTTNDKIKEPYYKDFNKFICFRPYNKGYIIKKDSNAVFKTLYNTNGQFQDIKENYAYYFYTGKENLLILDQQSFKCVDTIPQCSVIEPCSHNTRFIFLRKNNKTGFYIYDIEKLELVVNKRSNKKCNILLEEEDVYTYTSFTNEDEFDGTNLLKVSFRNNEKSVVSLLEENNMNHCSEILYEDIKNFDNENFIGFLNPQNAHNVLFTNSNGKITGSIGHASGYQYGLFSYGSFEYDGTVKLNTSSKQTHREKDNFKLGFLISKNTGKETGIIYQIFDDGQKIRLK